MSDDKAAASNTWERQRPERSRREDSTKTKRWVSLHLQILAYHVYMDAYEVRGGGGQCGERLQATKEATERGTASRKGREGDDTRGMKM